MKTLSIKKYEFETRLRQIINGSELPAFVIESVLKDVIAAVKSAADDQLRRDLEEYKKEIDSKE